MDKKPKSLLRIRTIAVTEVLLAVGLLLVANLFFFNGDRFNHFNPHPFWFVVILISAQYGVTEGCFAVVVSTLAFLVGNMRGRIEGEYLYSYLLDVYTQPLLWLVTALIVGSLRYRHILERDRLREDLSEAEKRQETIATHYEKLRVIKEKLEQRLVRQLNTTTDSFKAARLMETFQPTKIVEGLQDLVNVLIAPQKFSVYLLNGDTLEASVKHGWANMNEFPSTLKSSERLFQEVVEHKRVLCVANPEDETALQHHGMLAGPIMSEQGQIMGMLKIEDIAFTDLHVSTVETFRAVCTWIGNAYFQAHDYQKVSSLSIVNPENSMLSYEFYKLQLDYLSMLAKRLDFDLSLVMITLLDNPEMSKEERKEAVTALGEAVKKELRRVDQICNYQVSQDRFYILLPGTPEAGTKLVVEKVGRAVERAQQQHKALRLSFTVQAVHEKQSRNPITAG